MNDTDELAAETRRLLDAATQGDWDQVGATVEKEEDVGWCIVVAECDKVADAALIAAAPRLLANWLAREDKHADATVLDVLADWWFATDYCNQPEPFKVRVSESIVDALREGGYEVVPIGERDRLADENRELREALGILAEATTITDAVPDVRRFAQHALAAADRGDTDGDRNEGERT